jgi:hypothetical protein
MKDTLRTARPALLAIAVIFLGGCSTVQNISCDMHETRTRGVKPFTQYHYQEPKPGQVAARNLPAGSTVQAPTYKMEFKPRYGRPCTTLTVQKEVIVLRSPDDVFLTELREVYAEDGTLITTHIQDISDQVKKSGNYVATTPLPIPKGAPDGKYRVVSKLMQERRAERKPAIPIARAEGYFYILPLE